MNQLMLIILAVTLSPLIVAQTSDKREVSSSIEGELIKLEQQKDQAYLFADKEALERLYAEEFTAINAAGGISRRKDFLHVYTAHGRIFDLYQSDEITVRAYGETAIVTGLFSFRYDKARRIKGKDSNQFRYTNIYVKKQGGWQIVASQFTRVDK